MTATTATKRLGDYVRVRTGKLDANASSKDGTYPFFTCAIEPLRIATHSYDCECVLVAGNGDLNVKYFEGKFDAYQRTYIIESLSSEDLCVRYLFHFMSRYVAKLRLLSIGGVIKYIKLGNLTEAQIPLPPLSEQKRIAEILDRAEALRAKRRAALALLDELTQSIFLDMFGDPAVNSKGLATIELGELGKWASGGTPPRGREDYFVGSIPWFSSGELNEMFVSESHEHISDLALTETAAKRIAKGSLMLGMYDTAALKTSIAAIDCSCNQAIAFASIDDHVAETLFVYYAIKIGREHFRRLQRGVRQKNLNLTMIRQIRIPNPPLSTQAEFVKRSMKAESNSRIHRNSEHELDQLFASLQHRAFRGEL